MVYFARDVPLKWIHRVINVHDNHAQWVPRSALSKAYVVDSVALVAHVLEARILVLCDFVFKLCVVQRHKWRRCHVAARVVAWARGTCGPVRVRPQYPLTAISTLN